MRGSYEGVIKTPEGEGETLRRKETGEALQGSQLPGPGQRGHQKDAVQPETWTVQSETPEASQRPPELRDSQSSVRGPQNLVQRSPGLSQIPPELSQRPPELSPIPPFQPGTPRIRSVPFVA